MKTFNEYIAEQRKSESTNIDKERIYKKLSNPRSPQEPTLKRNIDIWVDVNHTNMNKKDVAAKYGLSYNRVIMISNQIQRAMRTKFKAKI